MEETNVIWSKLEIFSDGDMKSATRDFDIENKLGERRYGAIYLATEDGLSSIVDLASL